MNLFFTQKISFIDAVVRKKNFLRIKQLVLVGGPDDGVIIPWESSMFGYYDNKLNIRMMKDQNVCFYIFCVQTEYGTDKQLKAYTEPCQTSKMERLAKSR